MTRRALVFALWMGTLVALPAQEQLGRPVRRDIVFGEVRTKAGKPWVGAKVFLLARPLPTNPDVGEPHLVQARTDQRGRFRAEAFGSMQYSAWAQTKVEGGWRVTEVFERAFVAKPVLLKEREDLITTRSVIVERRDAWRARRPLRLRVIDYLSNRRVVWVDVGEDGKVTLPHLLGKRARLDVFATFPQGSVPIASVFAGVGDRGTIKIELPPPVRRVVWARSGSKPLEDAEVFWSLNRMIRPIGRTDASGRFEIEHGLSQVSLCVLGKSYHMGLAVDPTGLGGRGVEPPKASKPGDLVANPSPVDTLHIRVIGSGGEPMVGVELLYFGWATRGGAMRTFERLVRTDAEGLVQLGGVRKRRANPILFLGEQLRSKLPEVWRSRVLPIVTLPLDASNERGSLSEPIVIDLAKMCPVTISFRTAKSAPAEHAEVAFRNLGDNSWGPFSGGGAITDHVGRITLLLPARARIGVRAVHEGSVLVRAFETSAAVPDAEPATRSFQLGEPAWIRGQVVDGQGRPVANATVKSTNYSDDPVDFDYPVDQGWSSDSGNRIRVVLPRGREEARRLTYLAGHNAPPTDAEGRFELAMPKVVFTVALYSIRNAEKPPGSIGLNEKFPWKGKDLNGVTLRVQGSR